MATSTTVLQDLAARPAASLNLSTSQLSSTQSNINADQERDDYDITNEETLNQIRPNAEVTDALQPVIRRRQISVLLASFFSVFLTIGLNQAYGVFLVYYLTTGSSPSDPFLPKSETQSRALLAFVGTLGAGLTWAGSIVVNPLMARVKDPRRITATGAVLISLGYILASFCSRVWQLLLTQGLIYGIGTSLMYFPMLAVAPEYFDSHRGSAMGFILSAAGIGGLTYAPSARALLTKVGAAWTLRIMGFVDLFLGLVIASATPQPRITSRRPTLVNVTLARKPTFVFAAIGAMSQAGGNFVPLTFLPEFSTRLDYSPSFGAALLAILNAVNTISRIAMGFIADIVGRQNTLVLSVCMSSVAVVAFWYNSAIEETSGKGLWIAFVITYGVFSGGYNALFPTTVVDVFGTQAYASVNGFLYFIRGLGALWGSPVGGQLIEKGADTKAYLTVIWYDFGLLLLSSVSVILVRAFDAWEKGKFKVKA